MLASPANRRKLYGLVLMAILVFVIFSFTGAPKMSAIARKPRIGLFMARGDALSGCVSKLAHYESKQAKESETRCMSFKSHLVESF